MSATNIFTRAFSKLKNKGTKANNPPPTNELAHPSFGINETEKNTAIKAANSLLFLMYSKENETLFI
ncbi:hypothetical protein [Flavobacterium hercynium]|uniref:Uncharacterized protein n=1 Tax=Flavobacterium hercynium TaxID=387094 RepID=A0A226HGZ1_9FLAO|nr:hypothetical protein [Flavobacterium hercynium]OXA92921.1 hypothetical protein B0A66_09130 [Flavobacterium hercynium]SMP03220.1 hypothetical protein SAMN06265346_101259 [Flavobacterium hercynium]